MVDLMDCYLVVFVDQSGTVHCVPFAKDKGGNAKANQLIRAIRETGLQAGKYIPDRQNKEAAA
jgi:hypothetical protein